MYNYVLCEIFIPEKVKLSATPLQTEQEEAEIVQILLKHLYDDTVKLLSFNKYYGGIESKLYDEDNDTPPGTYFTISVEMLETLYKTYKLRKNWKKHKAIILELIRREILFGDYVFPSNCCLKKSRKHILLLQKTTIKQFYK